MAKRLASAKVRRPGTAAAPVTLRQFLLRALIAFGVCVVLWVPFSEGYLYALRALIVALSRASGALIPAPSGVPMTFVLAVSVMSAARASAKSRALLIALLVAISFTADVLVMLVSPAFGLDGPGTAIVYNVLHEILPFLAVLVVTSGDVSRLWRGSRSRPGGGRGVA